MCREAADTLQEPAELCVRGELDAETVSRKRLEARRCGGAPRLRRCPYPRASTSGAGSERLERERRRGCGRAPSGQEQDLVRQVLPGQSYLYDQLGPTCVCD